MKIVDKWQLDAIPFWIKREDDWWNEVVDEESRKIVLDLGLVKTGDEGMAFVMNHPNVRKD